MALPVCNVTGQYTLIQEEPVWRWWTLHHFGIVLSAILTLGAILMSLYLIFRHATCYLKPWQQRHIIRVLFVVPVYSAVSFLSYFYYYHSVYFEVLRDCYEALTVASFFALLCSYTGPDLHSQKDYFRNLQPHGWMWPLNWLRKCGRGEKKIWRTPRSGLTWFNIIWFGVFQYCFVRVFMTVVAVIAQATGRYCTESIHPAFAHLWVMLIEGGSVTVAMYCLVQFYVQLKDDLAEHKPLLKITAVKLVIFLSFWQTVLITFLASIGVIKPSSRFAAPDIKIGIPSFLLCIEMVISSIFHLWAFPWKDYDIRETKISPSEPASSLAIDAPTSYSGGRLGIKALLDAFNPWDLIRAVGRGFRWVVVRRRIREQDVSYTNSGRILDLEPTRKGVSLQLPFHRNDILDQQITSSPDDDKGSLAPINGVIKDEEEKAVKEGIQTVSDSQPEFQTNPNIDSLQDEPHNSRNTNQASTNISAASLQSESTNKNVQATPSLTKMPELPQPVPRTLVHGSQDEDLNHDGNSSLTPSDPELQSSELNPRPIDHHHDSCAGDGITQP